MAAPAAAAAAAAERVDGDAVDVGDRQLLASVQFSLDKPCLETLRSGEAPDRKQRVACARFADSLLSVSVDYSTRVSAARPGKVVLDFELTLDGVRPCVDEFLVVSVGRWKMVGLEPRPGDRMTVVSHARGGRFRILSTPLARVEQVHVDVQMHGKTAPALGWGLHALRRDEAALCDVVLHVEGVDLLAHKAALAVDSPVFRSMFTVDCKEAKEGRVAVEGVSRELFDKFLKYLYTRQVDAGEEPGSVVDLLVLGERYMVDALVAECERILMDVRREGVVALLREVVDKPHLSSRVRSRAAEVVAQNWEYVSASEEWAAFEAENPVFADLVGGAARKK